MRALWVIVGGCLFAGALSADPNNKIFSAEQRQAVHWAALHNDRGPVEVNTLLTSGVPVPFSIPTVSTPTLFSGDSGFRIVVPSGATRLEVRLGGLSEAIQFAIGLRYGADMPSGQFTVDNGGIGNQNPVVVTSSSTPPLRAGTYYIGLLVLTNSIQVNATITVTVDVSGSPPPTPGTGAVLTSGIATPLSFPTVPNRTLFRGDFGFRIVVPADATQLEVRLLTTTPGADLDLFARFGVDVELAEGRVVADFGATSPGGNEIITITPASAPSLREGTYFIALGVITTGTGITGTITATVTPGGGAPPPPAPAISVSAATLNFSAQAGSNPPPQTFTVHNSGGGALEFQVTINQPWASASPNQGSSTGQTVTITASINTSGLSQGIHNADIRVAAASGQITPAVIAVVLSITSGPPPVLGIVSGASFAGSSVAAESIVSAFGPSLALATEVATTIPLPTSLGGTQVRVTDSAGVGRFAELFFVSSAQINFAIPRGTALGRATITVIPGAGATISGDVQVDAVAPALFTINSTGSGAPAALALRFRADGSQSTEPVFACGASPGSCEPTPINLGPESEQVFLSLFGTGIRGFSRPSAVTANIGGEPAEVLGAAPQPQFVGLDQVNVRLSRGLIGRGQLDVVLNVDGKAANTVVVNVGGTAPPPPAGTNYLPVAPGTAWTYRVTFAESARLPYQPTFEQTGLFCTSLHCGFRTWDAGMMEFQMTVGERFDDPAGGDSYRLSTTGQANEFFFANSQDRLEIRVRRRDDADQLELVGFLAFRSYRPLARFQSSDLASAQAVTVPAGTYQNVVRTLVILSGGSSVGNETWTTEVFLAPGVGMIRAVMRDSTNRVLYTQELTSFTGR